MSEAVLDRGLAAPRPVHLWVVGILSLLWNSVGAFDYLAWELHLGFYLKQYTPQQIAYMESLPLLVVVMWSAGVFGAFSGSIELLIRRRRAFWAFVISLVGLAFNTIYTLVIAKASPMAKQPIPLTVAIWVIAIALLAYSWKMRRSPGVLR